jgi:hypothetical protein
MKRVRLSRSERRRLQGDTGALAESLAAGKYEAYSEFVDSGEFDLATDSGSIAEVKSALSELANGNPGRFRLFKEQHDSLVREDRDGSAFYIFVLFSLEGREPEALMKRKNPADVGYQIGARGGWNRSGHQSGLQHKLPIDAVF